MFIRPCRSDDRITNEPNGRRAWLEVLNSGWVLTTFNLTMHTDPVLIYGRTHKSWSTTC